MLTKVEVRNTLGEMLTLVLEDISDGIILESIEGLNPVKATLVSSSFAQLDGAQYQSSRREPRNILLTLGLDPDYIDTSVRDLRINLYKFFMPKSEIALRFYMEDGLIVNITARVETMETIFFTAEPKVTISLMGFDPDFTELNEITVSGNTVSNLTEFPINYSGSVETGILFTLNVNRTLGEFTIYHRPADNQVRTLDFAASLIADDVLKINTNVGFKEVTRTRASVSSSLLYGMSPQSNWIELLPGINYFRVYAVGAAIPFTIKYTPRHGGL